MKGAKMRKEKGIVIAAIFVVLVATIFGSAKVYSFALENEKEINQIGMTPAAVDEKNKMVKEIASVGIEKEIFFDDQKEIKNDKSAAVRKKPIEAANQKIKPTEAVNQKIIPQKSTFLEKEVEVKPLACKGDIIEDGVIDDVDLCLLRAIYGMTRKQIEARYGEKFWVEFAQRADFDDNEIVELNDLAEILSRFGEEC